MDKLDLEAIEARSNAATPGPWEPGKIITESDRPNQYFSEQADIFPPLGECGPVALAAGAGNLEFIAHAREDIPALIAEVRRLQSLPQGKATEIAHASWCLGVRGGVCNCQSEALGSQEEAGTGAPGVRECWVRFNPSGTMDALDTPAKGYTRMVEADNQEGGT